jgi:hypothetical protein
LEQPYEPDDAKRDLQRILNLLDNIEENLKQQSLATLPITQEHGTSIKQLCEKYDKLLTEIGTEKLRIIKLAEHLRIKMKETLSSIK